MQRRHFETFDALRFLAFFCVFLSHLPIIKGSWLANFQQSGVIGVRFFFVLSGFLITYILLFEKQKSAKIDLRNFFIRRILRIWPLFFAMLLFAFLTPVLLQLFGMSFSSEGYAPNWLMSILFLENYQMMATNSFPNVSPLYVMWSLCIEEHFYIFWGLLLYLIPIRRLPYIIPGSIILAIVSRVIYFQYDIWFLDLLTNIDYFALGAIPAYCLFKYPALITKAGRLPAFIKYFVATFTLLYAFLSHRLPFDFKIFIDPLLFGTTFVLVLLFTLPSKNNLFVGNTNIMSRLGKYTYGLYLLHTICINLLLQVSKQLELSVKTVPEVFLFGFIAFILSVLAAIASYHLYEEKFLKLKSRFSRVSAFAE